MNARQKAKKYKHMYEVLTVKWKPPIELKKEEYEVDTLKSDLVLDEKFVAKDDMDYIKEVAINDLTQYLVKHFDKYVNYDMEHLPYTRKHILHLELDVLRRPNNDNSNA